jgi:hypothetical protein
MKLRRKRAESTQCPDLSEARRARVESERAVQAARRDWPAVRAVTEPLRAHRATNGFGELLAETIRDVR